MEKILAKTIVALSIGFTLGLFTGYTINATKYYAGRYDYRIEITKEKWENKMMMDLLDYPGNLPTLKKERKLESTKTKFNYKVALLSGSSIVTIIILLFLGQELKSKKDKTKKVELL